MSTHNILSIHSLTHTPSNSYYLILSHSGFPQHPHRGFETITATMKGLIDHADSAGNAGRYGEGDVQWMTAGGGIVHGEMFPLVHSHKPNHLGLFQIWLNLPARSKMVKPSFAMFWNNEIPIYKPDDGLSSVHIWAGDYFNKGSVQNKPPPDSWASDPNNDVAIMHIKIQPGGKLTISKANKNGVNRSMYLIEGYTNGVIVDGKEISQKVCLEMDATKEVLLEVPESSSEQTEFLLLQGKPIGEPVAQHGPFVMNTQQEIKEAFMDYQRTQFGGWSWPRDDMIFPQDKGRFALVDGEETRPPAVMNDDEQKDEL